MSNPLSSEGDEMASRIADQSNESDTKGRGTFDFAAAGTIPRIGPIGRRVRLGLGVVALAGTAGLAHGATRAVQGWDGAVLGAWPMWLGAAFFLYFFSYAINTALGRDWGNWPIAVVAAGAGLAVLGNLLATGAVWGPGPAAYLLIVAAATGLVIGVGHLLQAALATPGCEMRAYADLWGTDHRAAGPGARVRPQGARALGRLGGKSYRKLSRGPIW